MKNKVLIAGGSGYLGQAVARYLISKGKTVIILSRNPRVDTPNMKWLKWDGENLFDWKIELENAEALINLAGHSIACVHNEKNKKKIIDSRINSVKVLGEAMQDLDNPPAVWIQASAVGYYGDSGETICSEDSPKGNNFLAEVCADWEKEFDSVSYSGRRVIMRLGSVIGKDSQLIKNIEPVVKFFLGGAAGSGDQYLSWVHVDDVVAAVDWVLNSNDVSGTYNIVAPQAVTNSQLMKQMRNQFNRPWVPAAPKLLIKLVSRYIMQVDGSLVLASNRSSAQKLQEEGFQFSYPNLSSALGEIYG